MKNLFILFLFTTGCFQLKNITDAQTAHTVRYEKLKNSTHCKVVVVDRYGTQDSLLYNLHCYNCKYFEVPSVWTVATMKDGKKFIEPLK